MEERHQVEIKVYKQKVKHLLYEHQNSITQLKTDLEMATKLLQDEHRVSKNLHCSRSSDSPIHVHTIAFHSVPLSRVH